MRSRTQDLLLAGLFVATIWLPIVVAPFADGFSSFEARRPAPFPELKLDSGTLSRFSGAFELWQRDHFGARSELIQWQSLLKYRLLHLSSSPDVVLGKEGFLHYRPELEAHLPGTAFTPEELQRWRAHLESEQAFAAAHGARFLFLIAPDKSTIYPETLPDDARWRSPVSRLDQLIAALGPRPAVELIDPRDRLRSLKAQGLVYEKTDTHWNERGALAATALIAERLGRVLPPFEEQPRPAGEGGDLARMLSLPRLLREDRVQERRQPGQAAAAPKGAVYLLHDSFGLRLLPLLPAVFERVEAAVGQVPRVEPLQALQPDAIVVELVERSLGGEPPPDPLPPPPDRPAAAR